MNMSTLGAILLALLFAVLIGVMFIGPWLDSFKSSAKSVTRCDNGITQNQFDSSLSDDWTNHKWDEIIISYDDYKKCAPAKSSSIAVYAFKAAVDHCSAYPQLSAECQTIKDDLKIKGDLV